MSKTEKAGRNELGEREIRFHCVAPGAQNVFLVGTFNSWIPTATPMEVGQAGQCRASVDLSPGPYEYKYLVDGVWCCEPGVEDEHYAGEDAVLNPFGTKNRLIQVE